MFSWPDAITVIGILLAAILGGKLDILPKSLVTALVMAVVGYVAARTLLAKRAAKWKTKTLDEDGGPSGESSSNEGGGVVEIAKQQSSRIQVHKDGSITIGPVPGTECKPDDETPPEGVPPVDDGMEPKE